MTESFSTFSARTGETDPLRALSSFVNYSKTELLKAGQLTPEADMEINSGAVKKASELGLTQLPETEDQIPQVFDSLFGDKPSSDLYAIQARVYADRGDEESAQKLRAYAALQSPTVKNSYDSEEGYASALESAKAEADPLFSEAEAKRYAVKNGIAKVASFVEGGRVRVEHADGLGVLDDKSLAEYASANSQFVSPNHLAKVRDQFKPVEGLGLSPAQLEKSSEIGAALTALVKTDPAFAKKLDTGTRGFELANRTTGMAVVENAASLITGAAAAPVMGVMEMLGKDVPMTAPLPQSAESIAEDLATNHELGRRYSKEQLKNVVQDMITMRGIDSLEYDEKNPASVARTLNNGQVVLPTKSLVNKQVFDTIVKNLSVSDYQKDLLKQERSTNLDAYAKVLMPQIIEAGNEGLIDIINERKKSGKSDGEILEEVSNSPEYSGAFNRVENFGLAMLKTATDLIPAVGAVLPDIVGSPIKEIGYGINKKISSEMAANSALAGLTGKDFGWVQSLTEQAPQLIADIFVARGAGKASTAISKGLGSSFARLAPKTAARMEMFAANGSSSAAKEAITELTKDFIPDANTVGWLTSQGTRTFGSTYTSVRSSLETQLNPDGSSKHTPEQIDALATEAGLINATIGVLTTQGFNKIGGGSLAGAETLAAGQGFSRRALKKYYDDVVAGVSQLPDDIGKAITSRGALPKFEEFAGELSKSFLRPFAAATFGEAAEEYLQTVGEDVVNAMSTGQELDLVKTTRNAGFAASLGAALGGAAKGISMAETEFLRDPQYRQADFEEIMLSRQAKSLRDAGAPATAEFIETQLEAAKAKKQTIRQQLTEYSAERAAIEANFKTASRTLTPIAGEPTQPLGLPLPELDPESQSRYEVLSRRKEALERKIAEAEAAVPEEQRTDKQSARLANLREARNAAESSMRAVYSPTSVSLPAPEPARPSFPMEGGVPVPTTSVITGYIPPALRGTAEGAFLEQMAPDVSDVDAMDDDAVMTAMDEASLDFGLPETDADIDSKHAVELRKVVPMRVVQRFAKSATNEQRSLFAEGVAESRAAYKAHADRLRMLDIQRQSAANLEAKIAELEVAPSEQKSRIAQRYRQQLTYVQQSITESANQVSSLKNAITESLTKIRDTVSNTQSYDQAVEAAMTMVEQSAVNIVEESKASSKPTTQAVEAAVAEVVETFGEDVAVEAAQAIQARRSGKRSTPTKTTAQPTVSKEPQLPRASVEPVSPSQPDVVEQADASSEPDVAVGETLTDPAEILRARRRETASMIVIDENDDVDRAATKELRNRLAEEAGMTRDDWETEQSAKNQESKKGFFDALNEGDTLTWTDSNGLQRSGVVEYDLSGNKKVRDTTEGHVAQDYTYSWRSGEFDMNADSLKVTRSGETGSDELGSSSERLGDVIPGAEPSAGEQGRNAPDVEQELASEVLTPAAPSSLDILIGTPEPAPATPDQRDARNVSDEIARQMAKLEEVRAIMNRGSVRKQVDSDNAVKRQTLNSILEGNETVEHLSKGKVIQVPLLRDINDPASFVAQEDFDLFHELLNAGTAPKSITWLNERLSYKHADYNRPFLLTLRREIESKFPVIPHTPPEQLYSKEDLAKAMAIAKFERGGMVTPRMEDFLNDYRSGLTDSVREALQKVESSRGKELAKAKKKLAELNKRVLDFDNDLADLRQYGSPRLASSADRAVAISKIISRVKQAGVDVYRGVPVTLNKDGSPSGVHTNNPYDAASLMERGIELFVPKNARATLNPAIEINRRGYVTRVKLAEQDEPVTRANPRSKSLESKYVAQENDPDFIALVSALPPVSTRHAKLLGTPFGGQASAIMNEDDFITPVIEAFNKGTYPAIRAVEESFSLSDAQMSDFQNAVVTSYVKSLREFSLAARIKEAALENKVMPLMRRIFIDPTTKELSPSVRRMLKKDFPKAGSDIELLAQYAQQLDAELTDTFTVQDPEGDLDDLEVGEAFTPTRGPKSGRWYKAPDGRVLPAPFDNTLRDVRKRFADGWQRRVRVMTTPIVTENGQEVLMSGAEQSAMEIQVAMEQGFLGGDVTGEVIDRIPVEEEDTEETPIPVPTGNPVQDAQLVSMLVEQQGQLIDGNPTARAAFEKLASSYGLSQQLVKNATGVELLQLARGENGALRKAVEAQLQSLVATRVAEIGDESLTRVLVSKEAKALRGITMRSTLTPEEREAKIKEKAEEIYAEDLKLYSADAIAAIEADEAKAKALRDRSLQQATAIIAQQNLSGARAQQDIILAHVNAVAEFEADVRKKQARLESLKAGREADKQLKSGQRPPAQPTTPPSAPAPTTPAVLGTPISLPSGKKLSREVATQLLDQYKETLVKLESIRGDVSRGPEAETWKAQYGRTYRFTRELERLLAGKKKSFAVGKDINEVFYASADSTYDFTDNLIANTAQLNELGLEAGNNKSIFDALSNVPKRLKPVANLLLTRPEILSKVSVEVVTMPHTQWAGMFVPSSNTVVINRAKSNGRGVADVLVHELLHAATHYAIRNPESRGTKVLVAKLDSLRKKALEQATRVGYNQVQFTQGLSSLDEFVSYTFTSPDFQRMLREIDSERGFFRRVIDAIASWFGVRDDSVTALLRDMTSLVGRANMRPYGTTISEDIAVGVDEEVLLSASAEETPPSERVEEAPTDTIRTVVDDTLSRPMGVRTDMPDTVFINPALVARATEGLNPRDAEALTRKMMAHELAHLAGLQSLTPDDVAVVAQSLTGSELWDVADQYYSETIADSEARYKQIAEDRQAGILSDEQIAHEFLRMQLEKFTSGFTTEQDIAFYKSNPNLLQRALRYLTAAINKLRARIASPFDSRVAASLNRALGAYSRLSESNVITSEDDAIAKIASGEVTFLYTAPVPTTFKARGKWEKLFKGEFPQSVKSLVDERGAHKRVADRGIAQFEAELNRLLRSGRIKAEDGNTIRTAMGGLPEISPSTHKDLNRNYAAELEQARQEFNASAGTQADRDALDAARALAKTRHEQAIDKAYEDADNKVRADMKAARAALPADVVRAIDRLRKAIDSESSKLAADPHLPEPLRATITNNLGVYLTTSYRAFTTKGWFDMLQAGGVRNVAGEAVDFGRIRDKALAQFAIQAENSIRHRLRFSKMTKSALDAKVRDEVPAETQRLFDEFIDKYSKNGAGLALLHANPAAVFKALSNGEASDVSIAQTYSNELNRSKGNLLARKDLPPFLREMLGEISDPLETAVRTLATVNTLSSNFQFLSRLREQGLAEGWLVDIGDSTETDPVQAKAERSKAIADARLKGYVSLQADDERATHLNGIYGPEELGEALTHLFKRSTEDVDNAAASMMRTTTRRLRNAAGLAMGVKTLLSVGARARDFFSDILFLGPMQGTVIDIFNPRRWAAAWKSSFSGLRTEEELEQYISKLTRLGVLDNESNTTAMRQMFRAFKEGDEGSLNRIRESLFNVESSTALKKAEKAIKKLNPLEAAAGLSNTIGSHLKIALFEKELKVLNKAYPDRMQPDADGVTANEKEAARKVGQTTRTSSNVYPIAQEISRSGLGSLIAPFITFKAEMLRIILTTPELAVAEIRSGNAVESRRGFQRFAGWLATLSITPLVVSGMYNTVFALMFGDEEDKDTESILNYFMPRTTEELKRDAALKAGLPDWQQGNSVSFSVIGDKVRMLDLTFINPFSVWTDGILRSIEHIRTGETGKIPATLGRWVGAGLAGEQIAAGAVIAALNNQDDKGMPISLPSDPWWKQVTDRVLFVGKEGYLPPAYTFGDRLITGEFGSREAGTAEGRMDNRIETAIGELLGARPRVIPTEQLYSRAIRKAHGKLRDVRTATSVASSLYPQSEAEVSDAYDARLRAVVKRAQEFQEFSSQYEALNVPVGKQLRLAREAGVSKKSFLLSREGYAEAPKVAIEDLRAIYDARLKADGEEAAAGILKFLANRMTETGPLIRIGN